MVPISNLDRYLPASIREIIEQRYLSTIDRMARLEQVIHDPNFYQDPEGYPPFFADHGLVHHRDVAAQILEVIDTANGLLVPRRDEQRLSFMKGYGVTLAFIHDLGMADFSTFGRIIHPTRTSQLVFNLEFDQIVEALWETNAGNLSWRLDRLARSGALEIQPLLALRELLAMASSHSKSEVPVEILNDRFRLRQLLQGQLTTPLTEIYRMRLVERTRRWLSQAQELADRSDMDKYAKQLYALQHDPMPVSNVDSQPSDYIRFYDDFSRQAFCWLVSDHPDARRFARDVIDTLRCLRCADALRQRGTSLKTSGGYEIFIDRYTANAIFALRSEEGELFLLQVTDKLSAGEANIASSQIDRDGDLRISFHRGSFQNAQATRLAASNAALVVNDIQADAIESFYRCEPAEDCTRQVEEVRILLEGVDDNFDFADMVAEELSYLNPVARARVAVVPSLQSSSSHELQRYLSGAALNWSVTERREALERIARSGHKSHRIDAQLAFNHVRLISLKPGEVLVQAGDPSGFVYIPLGEGLQVQQLGGYGQARAPAWIPIGITGVIRGDRRNSTVIAESALDLLVIPKEVYLRFWHATFDVAELTALFKARLETRHAIPATLNALERGLFLKKVPFFAEISSESLSNLACIVLEQRVAAGMQVFARGDPGDCMYVIVSGEARVFNGDETLDILGKWDVFGEMALLDDQARMASVSAATDLHLLRLDREAFDRLMASDIELSRGVIRVLLKKLREHNGSSLKGNRA